MKKIVSLLLVVVFMATSICFVSANEQSQEVNCILEDVKTRIGPTDDYDEFNSSVSTYNGKSQYHFNWSKTSGDNYGSMSVTANSEGVIVSYNFYEESAYEADRKASINRQSSDEVLKIAEEMLKNLNPSVADSLKLSKTRETESLYSSNYSFKVHRYENSIPVMGNEGMITLSPDASKLLSFYIEYTDNLSVDSNTEFISRETAVDSFYKEFGMELKYSDSYEDSKRKIVLKYAPDVAYNEYISALDASVVEHKSTSEFRFASADTAAMNEKSSSGDGGASALTETEIKEIEKISGLMSIDEAEALVRKNKIICLTDNYSLVHYAISRDHEDESKYTYNLEFAENSGESSNKEIYVERNMTEIWLDASNGEIIGFYKSRKTSTDEKITEEEARKIADEAVTELSPGHFGANSDFIFDEESSKPGRYRYVRYVNQIPYDGNLVSVEVNLSDGSIVRYSIDFDEREFPSPEGVVTSQEACKKLFEQIDYSVWYLPVVGENSETLAVSVYAPERPNLELDAFSGELRYGVQNDDVIEPYTDINGHYAEASINTLAKFGVGFDGGKFNPDEHINQADFVALLMATFVYRHPVILKEGFDYTYLNSLARNNGIVKDDEYAPDSEISRIQAAIMLVRAIGAEEVAELESIFVPVFADVNENHGYTAILSAMGVVSGDEFGNFNPDSALSRADAAMMIYNYLSK